MRDKDPKITTQAHVLPAGLIDMERRSSGKSLPDFFRDSFQFRAESVDVLAHRSHAKFQSEKRVQDLHNVSSANLVYRTEVPDGTMDPRTELASSQLMGSLGAGLVPTSALELVASVLGHDGLAFEQLKGLIPQGLRGFLAALGVQTTRALLANIRIAHKDMIHLLNGERFSLVALMPLLSTWGAGGFPLPGSGNLRSVREWRLKRIRQIGYKRGDLLFQGSDSLCKQPYTGIHLKECFDDHLLANLQDELGFPDVHESSQNVDLNEMPRFSQFWSFLFPGIGWLSRKKCASISRRAVNGYRISSGAPGNHQDIEL
jgi:hypothetical protein